MKSSSMARVRGAAARWSPAARAASAPAAAVPSSVADTIRQPASSRQAVPITTPPAMRRERARAAGEHAGLDRIIDAGSATADTDRGWNEASRGI